MFMKLLQKNMEKQINICKSVTTQSVYNQPQDFIMDKINDGLNSPRGSISSNEDEEEKKQSSDHQIARNPEKINFAA